MPSSFRDLFFASKARIAVTSTVLAALVIAAFVGTYLLTEGQTYDFALNQKVSASAPLRLTFPEQMDKLSVEKELTIPTDLVVEREWSDNTLILKPKEKLKTDATYVVRVSANALKADGQPLGKELTYTFTVTGAPMVSAQIPLKDAKDIQANSDIVMIFDRPVVALTQTQGGASADTFKNWPVTISPALRGRWRWLGTTTAAFEPEGDLTLATRYTVTVPAGIKTISGDATEKEFTWSFETERPRVMSVTPSDGSKDSGPTTKLSVSFNQEMDLISAKAMIHMNELQADDVVPSGTGARAAGKPLAVTSVVYGTIEGEKGKKVTDKTVVVVTTAPLSFNRKYVVFIDAGIRGLKGDLGSSDVFTTSFSTVGDLKIKESEFREGILRIDFSSPVDGALLKKALVFKPAVDLKDIELSPYQICCDNAGYRVEAWLPFAASTAYTVTLSKDFKDMYGQSLKKPFELKFTTPELQPDAFLYPRGNQFGIFEKGKPPTYFLNQVNLSDMHVTLAELTVDDLKSVTLGKMSNYNATIDLKQIGDNVRDWHVKPTAKRNAWDSTAFDIEKYAGKLKPGLYGLTYDSPDWKTYDHQPAQESRIFVLTNLGVTLKYSGSKGLVWVTDLQTGEPVTGATVKFQALSKGKIITGQTDKDGFFETPISLADFKNNDWDSQPTYFVTVEKGDDMAFVGSDWNFGFQPYDFDGVMTDFRSPDRAKYRLQSSFYTERPLYGAGDTVHFKGIVRFLDWNGKYSLPDNAKTIAISVMDPDNKEVYAKTLKLSEFGSFSDSFPLAKEASLGMYWVNGKVLPEGEVEGGVYGNFSVLAYRKPEYKATVDAEKEDYYSGDTVKATINGQYYFGAPMAGAKVAWRASSTDYFFNKYTDGWYSFALEDSWCWYNCDRSVTSMTEGTGVLDAAGRLAVSFPADIADKGVSQTVTLEADLTDQNNQVVSTRAYTVVHKSKVYVGIRSDEFAVQSGQKAAMKLVTVNTDGTAAKNVPVELKVYSRKWNVTKQKGVDGEYYYDSQPEDTYLKSVQARTDETGKATADVSMEGTGEFRIVALAKDADGRESKAGWTMYLWGDTYFNWPRANNDRVSIIADKPTYKVGDTARLVVKSPFQGKGVKALVTVERENVMTKKVVNVESNALPIEVPITEDMVPTSYVSVVIMKPREGETFDENGLDTGAPSFKVGYVKLPIDTSKKKVTVNILTDKERYLPGEKVTVKLETLDASGNPIQTELSLGVVDLSLLDLTGFQMPDLVTQFYQERGLGVMTANMLTYLTERFKPGSKGGGGDGADRKRGNFLDTAYWNPRIVTDKNGQASVSFTLPDNLTTWQLLALGSTKNNTFGGFAKTVIETKKVILRPVRPRFAVVGDKITLGAIVHNYLDESRTFTVKLVGKGFTANGGQMEQKVTIDKDGQTKLSFPVRVSDAATGVTLRFTATTDGAKDDIEETIPVYRFGIQQTVATFGTTETQATEHVAVPTKKDAPDGDVTVTLAPSAAVYLKGGLEYLAAYPYGCAEQTMSAIIPNVSLKGLQGFEQFKFVDDATLMKNVSVGFQKIYAFQRADGGFGYWEGSSRSYPYLTAYILYGFKLAERAGYSVDHTVMSSAQLYLQGAVRGSTNDSGLDDASRAFALFVLSEYDSTDTALLNALYKKRIDLPLHAKAHLAMALKKAKMDGKAADVLKEIESLARIDARGAHFEELSGNRYYETMNTDARTTALALQAMVRIDPANEMLPKVVRGMLSSRHDGTWDTTQSTAQSVLSLVEFLKASKELEFNFTSGVEVAGKKVLDAPFTNAKLLTRDVQIALSELSRGKTVEVKVGKEGVGKLYYDVVMSYFYTPDIIQPAEEGIGIQREVTPLTKADVSMKVGTTQKVRLTITVPETRHFVAVESMLPAGFEPIDLQYATSQQNLLGNAANATTGWYDYYRNQTWRFGHIEYRDDRVFLFAEELPAGVYRYEYLERATTPGTFRERPAKVWEMYFPENYGQTSGGWINIGE